MSNFNECIYKFTQNKNLKIIKFKTIKYQIGKSYNFYIEVLSEQELRIKEMLGQHDVFRIDKNRYFHGIISTIKFQSYQRNYGYIYSIIFSSLLFKLMQNSHNRVYVNKTCIEVIEAILKTRGINQHEIKFKITAKFNPQKAITQYQETDFNFFQRIITENGLLYYFEEKEDVCHLIITDKLENTKIKHFNVSFENDLSLSINSIYDLTCSQSLLCKKSIVKDINEDNADYFLQNESDEYENINGCGEYYHCIDELNNIEYARQKTLIYQNAIHSNRQIYKAKTFNKYLKLNDLIQIEGISNTKALRIIGIKFNGDEQAGHQDQNKIKNRFVCELTLMPANIQYALQHIRAKYIHGYHSAKIVGENEEVANLDETGRYIVQYSFAMPQLNFSQRIYTVQSLSGVRYGMHFPYYANTEVGIVYRNGDIDRPVIMGVLNSIECMSPVSAINHTQHVLRTYLGHELIFDDRENSQSIKIETSTHHQLFLLENRLKNSQIKLSNQTGKIEINAKKKIKLIADMSCSIKIQQNFEQYIKQHYFLHTDKGNIFIQSGGSFLLKSNEASILYQGINIGLLSNQNLNFNSNDAVLINGENTISVTTKSLNLSAGQIINLNSNSIEFTVGASKLVITGGNAILSGNVIQLVGNV